ncbi:hypothetical protein ACNFJN_03555 [Xenorhabdus budapestensis]|uniref:Uncharacterized protein n=1 Tax=Xenorhabdus budapestensis TaxID=290110 RepID=A0ABX7VI88_XENBU|nr:hypothetical protein [Xenorhabdus budapestensis]QTL40461.1 hypothetical protein HGO23_03425 [Xenorhabdus budapestensis]
MKEIYDPPRFCNTDFDEFGACLNLFGVNMGKDALASMSSAPDELEKHCGFKFMEGLGRRDGLK